MFSCVLAVLTLEVVWRWPVFANVPHWSTAHNLGAPFQDLILFLWVFELGEGFRSVELLASAALRTFSR